MTEPAASFLADDADALPARAADDAAAVAAAKSTIAEGSKSFAAAARLFAPAMRTDAVLLYAWCRHCDDVIDSQTLGFATGAPSADHLQHRLDTLRDNTRRALDGRSRDPVFAAFGAVMRRHAIPERYAFDHLDGFALDVAGAPYRTFDDTLRYCYGVAGVVGLMMGRIMGVREPATLDRACDLGIAFQLTNIARDIVEDAQAGRVYLPDTWLAEAGIPAGHVADPAHRPALAGVAKRLIEAAEPYYASATVGIHALPFRAAWAIATARRVYRAIGTGVVRAGPRAWDRRVSTSTAAKLGHVGVALGQAAAAGFGGSAPPRAGNLWSRPR